MSPTPNVLVNGSLIPDGIDVAGSSTVTIQLADTSGVSVWQISCVGCDANHSTSTINASLSINTSTKTCTFTAPSGACALIFESKVNQGLRQGKVDSSLVTRVEVHVLTPNRGLRFIANNETTESDAINGWNSKLGSLITAVDTSSGGGISSATLPLAISGSNIAINAATSLTAGSLSATDKAKLDTITNAGLLGASTGATLHVGRAVQCDASNYFSSTGQVAFGPGKSILIAFDHRKGDPAGLGIVFGCGNGSAHNAGRKGWSINFSTLYFAIYGAGTGGGDIGYLFDQTAPDNYGTLVIAARWQAADNQVFWSVNGSPVISDSAPATPGAALDGTCETRIGIPLPGDSGSTQANYPLIFAAVYPSELIDADLKAVTDYGSGNRLRMNAAALTHSPTFVWEATVDWDGVSSTSVSRGSSPVTFTKTGNPVWQDISEIRIPCTDSMFLDSQPAVARANYPERSSFARIKAETEADSICVEMFSSPAMVATGGQGSLWVNGVFAHNIRPCEATLNSVVNRVATKDVQFVASGTGYETHGSKKIVELSSSLRLGSGAYPDSISGTYFTALRLRASDPAFVIDTSAPDNQLVIVGDSISIGYRNTNAASDAAPLLLRADTEGGVAAFGWASMLFEELNSSSKYLSKADSVAAVAAMCRGKKRNVVIVQAMTNDYAFGVGAATHQANLTAWCLALEAAGIVGLEIILFGATQRIAPDAETAIAGSTLDNYRTAASTVAGLNPSVRTYINLKTANAGSPVVSNGNMFSDGVHLATAGDLQMHDFIHKTIAFKKTVSTVSTATSEGNEIQVKGDLITLNSIQGIEKHQKNGVTVRTDTLNPTGANTLSYAAGITSLADSIAQSTTGVGVTRTLYGQQGLAGNVGGITKIGGGAGGTSGTNLAGDTQIDLGTSASGVSAKQSWLVSGSSILDLNQPAAGFIRFTTAQQLQWNAGSSVAFNATNANFTATNCVYRIDAVTESTNVANTGIRTKAIAPSYTDTFAVGVTSITSAWTQAASGAGGTWNLATGQQAFAGSQGGTVSIATGKGGTPGTDRAGYLDLELGQSASGFASQSGRVRLLSNGTSVGTIYTASATNVFYDSIGAMEFDAASDFTMSSTGGNVFFNLATAKATFFRSPQVKFQDQSANFGRIFTAAAAFTDVFDTTCTSVKISQADITTASATGATLTIQSQNATGTTATGGPIELHGGTGTSANGYVGMYSGATLIARAVPSGFSLDNALLAASIISPTALGAGPTANYSPSNLATNVIIRQDCSANAVVSGLVAGVSGSIKKIFNISTTNTLTLNHEDAASTAANRFLMSGSANKLIPVNGHVTLWYDASSQRWREL